MKKLILLSIVFLFIACPPTAKNSARIYIQRGEYEEARQQILIGLQQSPNDCEYYSLLAKVEIGLGNWVEASRAFQKGIKIDSVRTLNFLLSDQQNIPVYWQAFYNAAITLMGEGKYEEAVAGFRSFLEKYPKLDLADNAQFWIGECYMAQKQYEQAILAYQEVIKRYPKGNKVPSAILRQALAFYEIGDKISSKLLLKKVIKEYSDSSEAKIAEAKLKTIK